MTIALLKTVMAVIGYNMEKWTSSIIIIHSLNVCKKTHFATA